MDVVFELSRIGHKFHGGVITIGNFDGLHLGHQELFKAAKALGGPLTVLTFDPHPAQVLHPERGLKRIFPREDLVEHLPHFGVDLLVILPFDKTFAAMPAEEFLENCLRVPLKPKHLVAGYDFAFGRSRQGTLEGLQEWGARRSVQVHVVPPLKMGGVPVSSRRIREALVAGEVQTARAFLGRPFYLRGQVIAGAGRGKGLGFPTLNQEIVNEIVPAIGVYATRTRHGGQIYRSITNIGVNPTFGGLHLKVETHLLKTELDLRGQSVDVEFVKFLRPEMKFSGIEDLKKQIVSDILKANEALDLDQSLS